MPLAIKFPGTSKVPWIRGPKPQKSSGSWEPDLYNPLIQVKSQLLEALGDSCGPEPDLGSRLDIICALDNPQAPGNFGS